MARVTADQAAAKWQSRLSAATQEITNGVNGVTVAPGVAAAKQKALWLSRVQASQDKWAKRVSAVSLSDWQTKMVNVGIPRIAQGATANQPKVATFMAEFLPYMDRGVAKVKAMPKNGLEDSIARSATMIRHAAAFQRGGGAGQAGG